MKRIGRITKHGKTILGPDAVAVIERLAVVPWETVGELSASCGMSAERVLAALDKARTIGVIDLWPGSTAKQ